MYLHRLEQLAQYEEKAKQSKNPGLRPVVGRPPRRLENLPQDTKRTMILEEFSFSEKDSNSFLLKRGFDYIHRFRLTTFLCRQLLNGNSDCQRITSSNLQKIADRTSEYEASGYVNHLVYKNIYSSFDSYLFEICHVKKLVTLLDQERRPLDEEHRNLLRFDVAQRAQKKWQQPIAEVNTLKEFDPEKGNLGRRLLRSLSEWKLTPSQLMYEIKEFKELENSSFQEMFFRLFFRSPILEDHIKMGAGKLIAKDPALFSNAFDFINRGLAHARTTEKPEGILLFFLEFSFHLSKYLVDQEADGAKAFNQIEEIKRWKSEQSLSKKLSPEGQSKLNLMGVLFGSLSSPQSQFEPINETADPEEIGKTCAFWALHEMCRSNHSSWKSPLLYKMAQTAMLKLASRLESMKDNREWIDQFGQALFSKLNIDSTHHGKWEIADSGFPSLFSEPYLIDLSKGRVYGPEGRKFSIPNSTGWESSKDFVRLFKDPKTEKLPQFNYKSNGSNVQFDWPGKGIYQLDVKGNQIKRRFEGQSSWLTYYSPETLNDYQIPAALSYDHAFWRAPKESAYLGVFTDLTTKAITHYLLNNGTIQEADIYSRENVGKNGYLLDYLDDSANNARIHGITHFESKENITCYQNEYGIPEKFVFTRYRSTDGNPLMFILKEGKYVWSENQEYALPEKKPLNLLGTIPNYLYLESPRNPQKGIVLVPFHKIVISSIQKDSLPVAQGELEIEKYDSLIPKSEMQKEFSGTQRYFAYEFNSEKLKETSLESRLFLAYIHFSQKEYEKSIQLLKGVKSTDQLSPIALTVLTLIMNFDAGEDHPEAKAVYMHALFLKMKEKERLAVTAPDFFDSNDLTVLKRSFVYFADILGSLNNISHRCRIGVEEEKFLLSSISSEVKKLAEDPFYKTYQTVYLPQLKERLRFLETSTPCTEVKTSIKGEIALPELKMNRKSVVFQKIEKPKINPIEAYIYSTRHDFNLKINKNPNGYLSSWSFEEYFDFYSKELAKYNSQIKDQMRYFTTSKFLNLNSLFYTRPNPKFLENKDLYFNLLCTVHECATSGSKVKQEELLYRLLLWKQTIPELESAKIDFLICDLASSLQMINCSVQKKTMKQLLVLSDEKKYFYWQELQNQYIKSFSDIEKLGYAKLFKSLKEFSQAKVEENPAQNNYPIPLISPLEPIKQTPENVSGELIPLISSAAPQTERWDKLKLWSDQFMENMLPIEEKKGDADFTFSSDPLPENILKSSEENFGSSLKEDFKLLQEDYEIGKQLNQTIQKTISDENCKQLKENTAEWSAQLEEKIADKERSLLLLANKLEEDPLKRQQHLARLGGKTEKQIDFQDCLKGLLSGDGRNFLTLNGNLTTEDVLELSSQTLEIVDLKSTLAQAKRVIDISSDIESSANQPAARHYHCQRLSAELNNTYDFSRFENSVQIALRVFTGQTGMIPFQKQLNMIEKMLEMEESQPDQFKDIVIQLIMGGGKTSVIATIILYLAAKRKGRCAVFIVPQALLETVKTNLAESMIQAFQVKTEAISLSREEFTPFKLEQTYQLLKKVQNEEIVVVVDGITLQGLELEVRSLACKMKELIVEKKRLNVELKSVINPNVSSAMKEQIYLVNQELSQIKEKTAKIVSILRLAQNSFDGLIDEVDLILDCYQELNFVDGDKVQIDPSINHLLLTIAKALVSDKIFIDLDNGKKSSLKEYVKLYTNQQSLLSTENFQSHVTPVLASHLFENIPEIKDYLGNLQGSFVRFVTNRISMETQSLMGHNGAITKEVLQSFSDLKELSPETVQEDIKFLELFESLKQGDERQKEAAKLIAETKHFFVDLLPFTLTKIGGRNYGPTNEGKIIPYLGVNTPSQTEFGYHWEAAWYHYGWGASSKPSKEVIQFVTEQYQASAVYYSQKYEEAFEETAEYQEFFHLFGVKLDEMNIPGNLELAIDNLSKDLDKVLELQFDLIMKFVTYTPRRLSSNGFNLLDLLSSRRTMSATPWNSQGYGEKLTKRLESDLGTEGRILHQLAKKMQDKDPLEIDFREKNQVEPFTFTDFFEQVYDKKVNEDNAFKKIRGIIEAGGLFKTFGSNADVAKEWMEFLHNKQKIEDEKVKNKTMKEEERTVDPNIEGVLFFHADPGHKQPNTLYVWKKGSFAPERLGSSSPASLTSKGLIPANYVVYYDERHTTGVDILQAPEAVNLMTFDEKMLIRTKTQGVMRMRQFLFEQGVEMMVSKKTRKSLYQNGKSVKDLVLNAAKVQSLRKPQMMYRYFLQQIINVFVKNSVELVFQGIEQPMGDEKFADIVERGEKFFVTQLVEDPIVQHGNLAGLGNTKEMLKRILQQKWEKFQEAYNDPTLLNQVANEVKALKLWIDQATCLSENWKIPAEAMGVEQEVEIRVENNVEISIENEIEKDLEQELKRLEEGMPATPIEEPMLSLDDFTAYIHLMKGNPVASKKKIIIPLHNKLKEKPAFVDKKNENFNSVFEEPIFGTQHYFYSCKESRAFSVFHKTQRPPMQILAILNEMEMRWLLLSEREASYAKEHLSKLYTEDPQLASNVWLIQPNGSFLVKPPELEELPQRDEIQRGLIEINAFGGMMDYLDRDLNSEAAEEWLLKKPETTQQKLVWLKLRTFRESFQNKIYRTSALIATALGKSVNNRQSSSVFTCKARLEREKNFSGVKSIEYDNEPWRLKLENSRLKLRKMDKGYVKNLGIDLDLLEMDESNEQLDFEKRRQIALTKQAVNFMRPKFANDEAFSQWVEENNRLQFETLREFQVNSVEPEQLKWLPQKKLGWLKEPKQICKMVPQLDGTQTIEEYFLNQEEALLLTRDQQHLIPFVNPNYYQAFNIAWQIQGIPSKLLHKMDIKHAIYLSDHQIKNANFNSESPEEKEFHDQLINQLSPAQLSAVHGNFIERIPDQKLCYVTAKQIQEIPDPTVIPKLETISATGTAAGVEVKVGLWTSWVSPKMVSYLNNDQIKYLVSREQIAALNPIEQIPFIVPGQVRLIDKVDQIQAVPCEKEFISKFEKSQLISLTEEQIKLLVPSQIALMDNLDEIQKLQKSQWIHLSEKGVHAFSEKEIQELDQNPELYSLIPFIRVESVQHLKQKEAIKEIGKSQLEGITPEQVNSIKKKYIPYLKDQILIQRLNSQRSKKLKPKASDKKKTINQIPLISKKQLKNIDKSQLDGLTKKQILKINNTWPKIWEDLSKFLSPEKVKTFDAELVPLLPATLFCHLSDDQLKWLSGNQVEELLKNPILFNKISFINPQHIHLVTEPSALEKVTDNQINHFGSEGFNQLRDKHPLWGRVTVQIVPSVTAQKVANLSNDKLIFLNREEPIRAVSFWKVAYLTKNQLTHRKADFFAYAVGVLTLGVVVSVISLIAYLVLPFVWVYDTKNGRRMQAKLGTNVNRVPHLIFRYFPALFKKKPAMVRV